MIFLKFQIWKYVSISHSYSGSKSKWCIPLLGQMKKKGVFKQSQTSIASNSQFTSNFCQWDLLYAQLICCSFPSMNFEHVIVICSSFFSEILLSPSTSKYHQCIICPYFLFKVNIVSNQARPSDYEATEAIHILKKCTEGRRTFCKTFTNPASQTSASCLRPWLKNCKVISCFDLCIPIFKRKENKACWKGRQRREFLEF